MQKSDDIYFTITNDSHNTKYYNLWEELKKSELYQCFHRKGRGKRLVIGSIKFSFNDYGSLYSNTSLKLDVYYNLTHYFVPNDRNDLSVMIYDFSKHHYLSPLNYCPDLDSEDSRITLTPQSTVYISISAYENY